jgi:hypothetical protein
MYRTNNGCMEFRIENQLLQGATGAAARPLVVSLDFNRLS